MTLAEQQAFEQTRERIQRNLAELASLSRTTGAPGDFFPRFTALAADSLNAQGAAVWLLEGGSLRRVAEVRFKTSGYDADADQKRWVDAVLSQTASKRRPHIVAADDSSISRREVPPEGIANSVPHPFFYHPVSLGNQVAAVLQIWLPQAGDPRTYNDIMTFLGQLCGYAEAYLRGWQGAHLAAKNEQAQVMLRMQTEFVGELDPKVLQLTAANYLVDLLGADVACVFCKKGKGWVLSAASNQEVVDARAVHSLSLAEVAGRLDVSTTGAVIEASACGGELRAALDEAGLKRAAWRHLSSSKNAPTDRLLFAARNEGAPFPANAGELVAWAGGQLAKALDAATHFHHIPFRPLVSAAGRTIRAWTQNRRKKVLAFVVAPLGALAVVLAVPVPWKISTDCVVSPVKRAVVVAETSGKVSSILVREGDTIKAGQLLAKLDDTDYRTQLAISQQQLLRWQVEVGKAQSLGNEAERKIAELSASREIEAIRRIEYLRARTELRSPIDGMVLTRNLRNREGEALEAGKPFCEIGGLGAYELQMDIRQKDLGVVLSAIEKGRLLPVDFILIAHPANSLGTTLAGVANVSQIPEARKNGSVFIATAPFPSGSVLDQALKPGFTGRAKLRMGIRPLGWIISRPFLNHIRTQWGF
jgi:biotin carboxyl carrier protein